MANKKNHDFKKPISSSIKKTSREIVRFDKTKLPLLKKLLIKYKLQGFQQLFDYVVISGIVFRRPEILSLVRENVDKYKKYFNEERMARLKGVDFQRVILHQNVGKLYPNDQIALNEFVVEENVRKQWLFRILIEDGFLMEHSSVIDLIKKSQDADITKRKKTIARLLDDKYIQRLSLEDSNVILEKLTEEYDKNIFDDSFESVLKFKTELNETLASQQEEEEFEKEFEKKLANLRKSRAREINVNLEPFDDE